MRTACVCASLLVPLSPAFAGPDVLIGAEFASLRGVLSVQAGGAGGTFTAGAVSEPNMLSWGRLWRTAVPSGEALFDTGFVGEPNPADANISLSIGRIQNKRAEVSGDAAFTDVDGDRIIMSLTGSLVFGPEGRATVITAISSVDVFSDERLFDGPDGGSLSTIDIEEARGSLRMEFLYPIMETSGGRLHIGEVSLVGEARGPRSVPGPSAGAALLGVGAAGLSRRRRRGTGVMAC